MDIRFSGFGGQGIIKAGFLVGKAASLFDDKHATLTQSFGPEARGGACSAQVVVDEAPVLYPYIVQPNVLVSMSQEAYEKFSDELAAGSILLTDSDLVKPGRILGEVRHYAIPATRMAEELGNRIFANIIMVGFFTAITALVAPEAVKEALPGTVPDHFIDKNRTAFDSGFQYGLELLNAGNGKPSKGTLETV